MRTLHPAYLIADLAASLSFYTALGYRVVGRVDIGDGASLTMLKFPSEEAVTLELVHRPAAGPVDNGSGFSPLAVQVDKLGATLDPLSQPALTPGPGEPPAGPDATPPSWPT